MAERNIYWCIWLAEPEQITQQTYSVNVHTTKLQIQPTEYFNIDVTNQHHYQLYNYSNTQATTNSSSIKDSHKSKPQHNCSTPTNPRETTD